MKPVIQHTSRQHRRASHVDLKYATKEMLAMRFAITPERYLDTGVHGNGISDV